MNREFPQNQMYLLGQIDSNVKNVIERLERHEKLFSDLSTRTDNLEEYRDNQKGMIKAWAIVSGFVSSVVVGVIQYVLIKKVG